MAHTWAYLLMYRQYPPFVAAQNARFAAHKAIQVDDSYAGAHAALGIIAALADLDIGAAAAHFQRARTVGPRWTDAQLASIIFELLPRGALEEAEACARKVLDSDPVDVLAMQALGWTLYFDRCYNEAIRHLRSALDLDPDFGPAWITLAYALEQVGRYPEAIEAHRKCATLIRYPFGAEFVRVLEQLWGGNRSEAERLALELEQMSANAPFAAPVVVAEAFLRLGDKERTLHWLDLAWEQRGFRLLYIGIDPLYDALRGDERFEAQLARIGCCGRARSAGG
jgi:tetratricopeptide (TPR) repeat protein